MKINEDKVYKMYSEVQDGIIKFRLLILKLYEDGYSGPEIANLMSIGKSTVYYWKKRFEEQGIDGLEDRAKSGRPRKVDYNDLRQALSSPPHDIGYNHLSWDVELIQTYLKEHQEIKVSTSYIYQLLDRLETQLKCNCLNCPGTTGRIRTEDGKSVTPLHLELMRDVKLRIDAPIEQIITNSGIKPVLKVIQQDKDKTILQGETENGILTLQYEHLT